MAEEYQLPTGRKVNYSNVPRHVLWKHGRISQTFQVKAAELSQRDDLNFDERGLALLESLTDDERVKFQAFADDVVKRCTGEDPDSFAEIDYFTLVGKVLYSLNGAKVQTKEGETDTDSVVTFPEQSGVSGDGEDVQDISSAPVREDANLVSAHG